MLGQCAIQSSAQILAQRDIYTTGVDQCSRSAKAISRAGEGSCRCDTGAPQARERASLPVLTEGAGSLFDGLEASAKMGLVSRFAAVGRRSAVGASTGAKRMPADPNAVPGQILVGASLTAAKGKTAPK